MSAEGSEERRATKIDWKKGNGLIPVVVQDAATNAMLMLAYMNIEAYEKTKKTGYMHYWSRSRSELWKKGETSGNVQKMKSLSLDCDGDALLARVEQKGNACHLGQYSCFSTPLVGEDTSPSSIIAELSAVISDRKAHPDEHSYTCKLLADENKRLKKIGEESAELIMALQKRDKEHIIYESADLLYHLMVCLVAFDVTLDDVFAELSRRREDDKKKEKK